MKITHYLCFLLFLIGVCTSLNAQIHILEGESKHHYFDKQRGIFTGVAKEIIASNRGVVHAYFNKNGFMRKKTFTAKDAKEPYTQCSSF